MFPVTIESQDGRLQTYSTACYGFLRDYEWRDNDYSFCDGWHRIVGWPRYMGQRSSNEPFGRNCLWNVGNSIHSRQNRIELQDTVHIWNSGSVLPYIGKSEDGESDVAYQTHSGRIYYVGEAVPENIDNVAHWSREKGIPYSRRDFLSAIEQYVDKGRETAMVWDERGFMGVRTDIEADRSLFYLMIDRELWDKNHYKKIAFILDQIHEKGRNPMIAFLMSRLVSVIEGAMGDELYYCGSGSDGCILPDSLLVVGLGQKYLNPTAVDWFQDPYNSGNGHMRDEDIDCDEDSWSFEHPDYTRRVSASLFNSVFQLEQHQNGVRLKGSEEPAIPVKKAFGKLVVSEEIRNSSSYEWWALGELLESEAEKDNLLIPVEEWEDLIYNLLMGS